MSVKPDALGYAVCLDARGFTAEAAELRRLYAVNAELLDALRWTARALHYTEHPAAIKARAAIAKATEVKP